MDPLDLLERSTFVTRYGASDPSNRLVRRLNALAAQHPAATVDTCVEWLEDLLTWLFERGRLPLKRAGESELAARTRVLLEVFEDIPAARARLQDAAALVLRQTSATRLFTDTGLPAQLGLFTELVDRFSKNVLPEPPVHDDLSRLVTRLLSSRRAALWLLALSPTDRLRLGAVLGLDARFSTSLEPAMREAAQLLVVRIGMQGTADDVRRRLPGARLSESPFIELSAKTRELLEGRVALGELERTLARCREHLRRVESGLEETGISVDLVFRLDLLTQSLDRLALLLGIVFGAPEAREVAITRLERDLVRGAVRERSLRELWRSNTRLLARRLVERAGHSGEHYLTRTRTEQEKMLDAAAGGGAITALAVLTKFLITWSGLPLLFDALFVGLNYALAFVAMQLAHFTLATKQPSMTAATLAGAIEERSEATSADLGPLVELVARASRTQLAALVGNVGIVAPIALGLDLVLRLGGRHLLDAASAEKVVAAHHPFHSGTLYFAVMTGVWLWMASLVAGTVENWFVLRELEGAIATNRWIRRFFGAPRAGRFSRFVRENISGLGGNVGLGLLLGCMPLLFKLVGIPLEVRHVTFVAGQLVYAVTSLGPLSLARGEVLWALLSVPPVGLVNFSVSFALALAVALRARGLGARTALRLAREVARRLLSAPGPFFLAPAVDRD